MQRVQIYRGLIATCLDQGTGEPPRLVGGRHRVEGLQLVLHEGTEEEEQQLVPDPHVYVD